MEGLRKRHIALLQNTEITFKRYLFDIIPWDERLLGIKGSRGVGKTTLLLQYIKIKYANSDEALYISLDDLYFSEHKLIDLVNYFIERGGKHLFIDEVHKYKNWSVELKNIYDSHPSFKITFTGSSLLEILNSRSDLSRRALTFNLKGMSFREYLNFYFNSEFNSYSLEHIIRNHVDIAINITSKIKVLKHFNSYLQTGYFPFYSGNSTFYHKRLQEIINLIIEIELPQLRNTEISLSFKIKQLLYIISEVSPFKPNITALANKIKISRKTLLEYLFYLNDANILKSLHKDNYGISLLQKPEKLYIANTNYIFAINEKSPNIGSLRETFFFNQLSNNYKLTYPEKGDFKVNNNYIFEVGGKSKNQKQIINLMNSFIAADDLEIGFENKIPLWLFGFLY